MLTPKVGELKKGEGVRARPDSSGLLTVVAAYVRVSSRSQDYAYQRLAIERAARARGEVVNLWFADVASGRTMERPQLRKLREAIRAGRVHRCWVWRLDRLTRSGIVDTLSCVNEMKRHHCECASVADGFALDGPAAEMVLSVLAWAAQLEREKIRENQLAARSRMAAEGKPWGRPRVVTPAHIERIQAMARLGLKPKRIATELHLSRSSVWRVLHPLGPKAAAENMPLRES
jgi:DNA invertase Pin-like site-specific DNA recombinase